MTTGTQVKRRETFTVASAVTRDNGNLAVTDTVGKEHVIGVKRSQLFGLFQPGANIEVSIAEYMNTEYIAMARVANGQPTQPIVAQAPIQPPAQQKPVELPPTTSQPTPTPKVVTQFNNEDARTRSMALAYSKDLAVADKVRVDEIVLVAETFYKYIVSGK